METFLILIIPLVFYIFFVSYMRGGGMNTLKIMNYIGEIVETNVDLDNLDNIESIVIDVISGDEIATVVYKDGTVYKFDSANDRIKDYFDNTYILYYEDTDTNIIDEFNERTDSYWNLEM